MSGFVFWAARAGTRPGQGQDQGPDPAPVSDGRLINSDIRRELGEMIERMKEATREQRREFNEYKHELQRSREGMQREEYAKLLEESRELKKILKDCDQCLKQQQPVLAPPPAPSSMPVQVAPSDQKLISALELMAGELERQGKALEELKSKRAEGPPVESDREEKGEEYVIPRLSSKMLASRIREIAQR